MKISNATKKNWEKLETDEVNDLKLKSRANKLNSDKIIYPKEYFTNDKSFQSAVKIIRQLQEIDSLSVKEKMHLVILKYLIIRNMIKIKNSFIMTDYEGLNNIFKSKQLSFALLDIIENLKIEKENSSFDFLGGIYQMLQLESEKNQYGSYYTPEQLIDCMIDNCKFEFNQKILDPSCGSGAFLLYIAKKHKNTINKDNLYGFDIDEIAVDIAKVNLIVEYNDLNYNPQIFCKNTLTMNDNKYESSFDFVLTNPPWGKTRNPEICGKFLEIKNDEFFSFFIIKISSFLKEKGNLKIVLPESIKNVNVHKDIRKFIFDNFLIDTLISYGRKFNGVFTKIITLDLRKNLTLEKEKYDIKVIDNFTEKKDFFICNFDSNFVKGFDYSFLFLKNIEQIILKKMMNYKDTDLSNSGFYLGVVTGNNKQKIYSSIEENIEVNLYEPVILGKNIEGFSISKLDSFLKPSIDKFQQIISKEIYKKPNKLIYKFICNKPHFSIDLEGRYTLNSANILIPKIEKWDDFSVMAYLNSSIVHFFYKKIIGQIKILKKDLCSIPFPKISPCQNIKLRNLVNEILAKPDFKKENMKKINNIFYNIFDLSKEERRLLQIYE